MPDRQAQTMKNYKRRPNIGDFTRLTACIEKPAHVNLTLTRFLRSERCNPQKTRVLFFVCAALCGNFRKIAQAQTSIKS
jgi:hypothetical protein